MNLFCTIPRFGLAWFGGLLVVSTAFDDKYTDSFKSLFLFLYLYKKVSFGGLLVAVLIVPL